MRKILLIVILLLTLPACTQFHAEWGGFKPPSLSFEGPEGPPEYRKAFADGCESGFSGYGNSFNKVFHTWKQDPALAQTPMYYQMWKDAYAYCANYAMMADEHGLGNWR